MNEQVLCLTLAIVALNSLTDAQWQGGVPVAPPDTIRINVGSPAATPPPPAAVDPPPAAARRSPSAILPPPAAGRPRSAIRSPPPAAVHSLPPSIGISGLQPSAFPAPAVMPFNVPASMPNPGGLFGQPSLPAQWRQNALFRGIHREHIIDEIVSDMPCGRSRRPRAYLWAPETMGSVPYVCNCPVHESVDPGLVDYSPQAFKDCGTAQTGMRCCRVQ